MRPFRWSGLIVLALAEAAQAYPSSVVFAPTGEVYGPGAGYVSLYAAPLEGALSTWAGANVGLLPEIPYGASGLALGGLEVSFDLLSEIDPSPSVRGMLSLKLQALVETDVLPAVGVGVLGISPLPIAGNLTMGYLSATKSFAWGRLTLGGGTAALDPGAGWRLPFDAPGAFVAMAGYESPSWRDWSFAIDYLGSGTAAGSTNGAINWGRGPALLSVGYSYYNDAAASPPGNAFVTFGWEFGP